MIIICIIIFYYSYSRYHFDMAVFNVRIHRQRNAISIDGFNNEVTLLVYAISPHFTRKSHSKLIHHRNIRWIKPALIMVPGHYELLGSLPCKCPCRGQSNCRMCHSSCLSCALNQLENIWNSRIEKVNKKSRQYI